MRERSGHNRGFLVMFLSKCVTHFILKFCLDEGFELHTKGLVREAGSVL